MRRHDAPVANPPASLEAAVEAFVRERAGAWFPEEASASGGAAARVTLEPWRIRYWSFLRRAAVEWPGRSGPSGAGATPASRPRVVWLKMPKEDPGARELERTASSASRLDAVRREADAHVKLAGAGWGEPGAPAGVSFVRFLGWSPEIGLLATLHSPEPTLTPLLRRAKRRFSPASGEEARAAIRRAGAFLRHAHARLRADVRARAASRDAALRRFDAMLAALDETVSRFDPAARLRRHSGALRELLAAGYADPVPLVVTHRGVDARNVLDDGVRQTWLDPQESADDAALHDLARFIATLGIIDYGSLRGFTPPVLPRPWIDAFLQGYGAPAWLEPRALAAFTLYWLLDRFEDSRRIVRVQPWGPAVRGLVDALYTRRFYAALIGDALGELGLE